MEIKFKQGIGNISLNSHQSSIRHTFSDYKIKEFKRTKEQKNLSDHIPEIGIFIYYDDQKTVEAIEAYSNKNITLDGETIFDKKYSEIEKKFLVIDPSLEIDELGFTSYKFGFGVYNPYKEEIDSRIEAIILFRDGYYET